ncbi:LmeA family phospholipid-binding protein [Gordonia sputi]|uniref:LmeA family phospholipid-binding protein n=1 Tax=Gordonia sputi TaxID=36823 RepID=UPI002044C373|nr:LmeA family phospholipid-binding protein [Gordonia sputi]MCM3897786.1 LmeA family phospholipid-binding protein [Gordonia sputi]
MTDNEKEPQARPGDADASSTPDSELAPVADSTSSSTHAGASSTDHAPSDHAPADHAPTEQFAAAPTEPGPRAYSATDGGTRSFEQGTATTVIDPADPAGEPVLTSPVRRRRTAKIIGITAAALVLVLVIGAVASELILRKRVTDCLEQQFSSLTGVPTTVSLSKKPMLLQATGSEIPWVQVDTANDSGATRLHIRADRIDAESDKTTVGSLDGSGYVPFSRVVELGKQETGGSGTGTGGTGTGGSGTGTDQSGAGGIVSGANIESITGNEADGTVDVSTSFNLGFIPIPVSATIKPTTENGHIKFEVVKANAFVFGIPSDYAQQIVDGVSKTMFGPFFDQVNVKNLKVTNDGVDFAVDGDNLTLTNSATGANDNTNGCNVL